MPVSGTPSGGAGSFTISAGVAAATHTVTVCDVNAPTICGTSAPFVVTAPLTYAGSVAVATPANVVPGSTFSVSGTYSGGTGDPAALQYAFDNAGSFTTIPGLTPTGGTYTFTTLGGLTAGPTHSVQVRDPNNPSSVGSSANFAVTTPTAPGSATSLVLYAPETMKAGQAVAFKGSYGGNLTLLDYQLVLPNGTALGWGQPPGQSIASGAFAFNMASGNGDADGKNVMMIRDHYTQSVIAQVTFYVSEDVDSSNPNSPGASIVWSFDANNTTQVPSTSGHVSTVYNAITTTQTLVGKYGASNTPINAVQASGADSLHRAMQFAASTSSSFQTDPTTNCLAASSSLSTALIGLANSTSFATNPSYTYMVAAKLDSTYIYANFGIWAGPATGSTIAFSQLRYNKGVGNTSAQVIDASGTSAQAAGSASNGWHVFTMIKNAGTITYRMDGVQVATASVTSTGTLTANNFLLGGGMNTNGTTFCAPAPYVSGMKVATGVLQGADLLAKERRLGAEAGDYF